MNKMHNYLENFTSVSYLQHYKQQLHLIQNFSCYLYSTQQKNGLLLYYNWLDHELMAIPAG